MEENRGMAQLFDRGYGQESLEIESLEAVIRPYV